VRLLVTADLHFNHPRSRPLAEELIDRMNRAGGDVLVVVGDSAGSHGDALEQCLSRFRFKGPKLFVPGNHELWTAGGDSYALWTTELPRRCAAMGWQWLSDAPFVAGDVAIVGSLGWYDYSFAPPELGIPRRFYERKISPGVADRLAEYADLLDEQSDIAPVARQIVARWNDGVHVKLGRSDEQFLDELLARLDRQLGELAKMKTIVAAIHCLPFAELLPPSHSAQWDFAKAYLGSGRIGQVLLRHTNVKRVFCGHSHFPAETTVGSIHAVNIGSGYRAKHYRAEDVE
jgi:3',5'-cyclic AMP phosphodiesterase CpdA